MTQCLKLCYDTRIEIIMLNYDTMFEIDYDTMHGIML